MTVVKAWRTAINSEEGCGVPVACADIDEMAHTFYGTLEASESEDPDEASITSACN